MRIIKILSKKVKNKEKKEVEYYKYMLNLPKKVVEESRFEGKGLKAEFFNNNIIIKINNMPKG